MKKTGTDQYNSEFLNDNQTTYLLWLRDHHHSEFPDDNQTTYMLPIRKQQGEPF